MGVWIDIACNDPDNGLMTRRAEGLAFTIGDCHFEFEPTSHRGYMGFTETDEGFRLSAKKFRCGRSREWVGNWCWNSYEMSTSDAAELLCWLRWRKLLPISMP